ncbi:MAG: hypothetical protein OXI45_12735 [Acidobacteriota bacterium]|nr:hypothetical protein [Acidobacteriota bacterium]
MSTPVDERVLANVVEWAGDHDEWGDFRAEVFGAHFGPLMDALELADDALFERLGPMTPVVLTAVMEDFLACRFGEDGERNVVDEYLARRGWLEKEQAASYLRAVRDSTPSLYEVVALDPGRAVTVRDLVRETDPERVPDRQMSETVNVWDCFAGRLVGSGRTRRFTGGLLPFPREAARMCMEDLIGLTQDLPKRLRKAARKEGTKVEMSALEAREFLLQSPMGPVFFTNQFVMFHVEQAAAGPPGLRNTDDEPLVLSTVRFPMVGSESDLAAALDDLTEFDRDSPELNWSWRGRELPPAPLPKELVGDDPEAGTGYLSLGMAAIADGALLLHVNSVERAERGRELLASRLGALVGTPLTSHEDPAARLENGRGEPGTGYEEPDIPPAEMEAVIHEFQERHYRQVLDEPVPMLGNRSPRQAVKTKKGRAAVVEWLKFIENAESQAALQQKRRPLDLSWLWAELKIPRPGGKP